MADVFDWTQRWCESRALTLIATPSTPSTNTDAKNDASPPILLSNTEISPPKIFLTRSQTQGRGREDHVWSMPPKGALFSSWSFALKKSPQPILSPLIGLALYSACTETWPKIRFNLKAPNDLFIEDKKTAGLLIETIERGLSRHTVVGLGLNVMSAPTNLPSATSLKAHADPISEAAWTHFLTAWLSHLEDALKAGQKSNLDPESRERLKLALNRHPRLREPILNVDERGQLESASRTIYWHEL